MGIPAARPAAAASQVFLCPICALLRRQRKHLPVFRMHQHRTQHLVVIRDGAVPAAFLATLRATYTRRGMIARAVHRQQVVIQPGEAHQPLRCKAANTRLKATRSAAGSTWSSRSRIAVSDGARDTPYRFLRFDRMRSSLRRPGRNSTTTHTSARTSPAPTSDSLKDSIDIAILSKQPRTMRSNPGALSVLPLGHDCYPPQKTVRMTLFSAKSLRRKIF